MKGLKQQLYFTACSKQDWMHGWMYNGWLYDKAKTQNPEIYEILDKKCVLNPSAHLYTQCCMIKILKHSHFTKDIELNVLPPCL